MPDKTDPDVKIPVHPLLANLVGDHEGDAMALRGYVGPPTADGHIMLYPRLDDLSRASEFAREDVLTLEKAPESVLPNGGTIVWIKKNAEVILRRAESVKTQAQNLVGFRAGRLIIWRPFTFRSEINCSRDPCGGVCASRCNTCTSKCLRACSTSERSAIERRRGRVVRFR